MGRHTHSTLLRASVKHKQGKRRGPCPYSCNPVLGPGPDGPEATHRLLVLAEGVQECEARTCIERALDDPAHKARLGADRVKRCEELLDERDACMWKGLSNLILGGPVWGATAWRWEPGVAGHTWFLGSGWQERSRRLYTLAGEVQRSLGAPAPAR